jgi:CBS domain-containing protein
MGAISSSRRKPRQHLDIDRPVCAAFEAAFIRSHDRHTVEEIVDFLARFPPYDQLGRDDLLRVAASVTVRSYPAGTDILVEDGPPAAELFVIRSGSVELRHQDEVVDVLEPGESFGHPSLLTGMAAAFTVRAHEDATFYLIGSEAALDVLGRPAGAIFIAQTMRERLTRAGHTVHGLPEVRTVHISNLVTAPPVFCPPDRSVREAANLMSVHHVSALLIRAAEGLGIITDSDFRQKVVAGGVPPEAPVTMIMSRPLLTVRSDRYAVDAALDMLNAGVEHLAITDARGAVVGLVSAADLMGLAYWSPFALRAALFNAQNEADLDAAIKELPVLFVALVQAGLQAPDIGRVLALSYDALTTRLLEFAIARHGAAPCAWAWLALGSVARRELTLASDQDNALAYADPADLEVDAYFERIAQDVNAGLSRAGFGADVSGVLAGNPLWRMSQSQWVQTFRDCLESPDRSHLVRAAVAFDFRHVAGGLEIAPPLVAVLREAPAYPRFLAQLARTATDVPPVLPHRLFMRRWERQEVDLKKGGVLPIANLARFHALANGITISATLDRLVAAEELGAINKETAQSLREAFAIICQFRLDHHAQQIREGLPPDNLIRPEDLLPIARAELREAFQAIGRAQQQLNRFVPPGI